MASLFISHSSSDQDAAERLAKRLRAEGFAALFLDFDPDQDIPSGRNWERELYAQLRKTDAVIFLASAASVASRWSFAEVSLARSLNKPIFPLRLEGDARLELLDDAQWIDLAEGERAYARLWAGLRQAGLEPTDSFAWDPTRSPYPGLQPFSSQDAAVFFGRDREIQRLLEFVQPILQRGAAGRLVAIVGPSGSGKSSLVRAGLLPRLEKLKERWVVVPPVLPGQQPTRNLARSLAQAFSARGHERSPAELERYLDSGGPAALGDLASELAEISGGEPKSGEPNVLVVIDQAEELITLSGEREQQAFLELLGGALNEESPLWVVATVRSEFLSSAPERAGLADVVDDSLLVEPLSRARLPEVIERPAQRAGLDFEARLVARMVEETASGDALPLLAYTLQELWELMRRQGRPEGTVRFADYEAVGGVVGALQRRADWITMELTRQGQGPLILPTLLKLASIEGEEEPTRRRLRRSALAPEEQKVVDAFVEARLLTSGKSEGGGEVGTAFVEVAQDALLRQWAALREAIEEERSSLQMRSELERLAADWNRARMIHRNEDDYLLVRGRLDEFRVWAEQHPGELGPIEREFLRASEAQDKGRLSRMYDRARKLFQERTIRAASPDTEDLQESTHQNLGAQGQLGASKPEPVKIYISYSRKDESLQKELQVHLQLLKRRGLIEDWHDRPIASGQEFEDVISAPLEAADIVLLLISPDFIASSYYYGAEMARALDKHESGEARIIPVMLRPVDWTGAPFEDLQVDQQSYQFVGKFQLLWQQGDLAAPCHSGR